MKGTEGEEKNEQSAARWDRDGNTIDGYNTLTIDGPEKSGKTIDVYFLCFVFSFSAITSLGCMQYD